MRNGLGAEKKVGNKTALALGLYSWGSFTYYNIKGKSPNFGEGCAFVFVVCYSPKSLLYLRYI